jgi:isopenicillin N synthase-like dioxygenase
MSRFGTSILVPSVHELAKETITEIPHQFLQLNQDPTIVLNTASLPQVPVIDLGKLLSKDAIELEKLDHACKEWGFFQLINHGVNTSLIEKVKVGIKEFLSLPVEEKKKFWQTPNDMEGFGQMFVVSDDQKLEWADLFLITTLPLDERNPRLFPSIFQPFRDNLEIYCSEVQKLCFTIISQMEKALKIESNEVTELFNHITQAMRWNLYPPCPQPENVIGLNPHSDVGALTILLQANEIEGLQIRKDGQWIPVQPLPNAFVINIGDMLEIVTNGIYRSIEHRATVNKEKERISIAAFHRPHVNTILSPRPSLVTSERPAAFKSIAVGEYLKAYFSRKLEGKSCLDVMRIENGDKK